MVAASLLSDAEFGPNHHRKEIAHFINSPFQPEFRATLLGPIGIGLCLGYSSGAIESIKDDPNIDPTTNQISWFGSILTVGAAIGSLLSGNTIDKMGRKFHILLGNLCFVIGWLLFY